MAQALSSRDGGMLIGLAALAISAGLFVYLNVADGSRTDPLPLAPAAPTGGASTVEFDRFSALWERSPEGERLRVSLRLRAQGIAELPCFAFLMARNDRTTPKVWAIWPPQPPGPVVTYGGHFLGTDPSKGHAMNLTERWEVISAVLPRSAGRAPYDTVLVYVLGANGRVYLARPFRV